MNIPYVMKQCNKCGEWLVASKVNFYKHKKCKYELETRCKKCRKKYSKQYYEDNKETINEYSKQYYEDNKETIVECGKKYYKQNKEAISQRHKQYYEKNKKVIKEYSKQYKKQNKEAIKEYIKQYREQNKEVIKEYKKQYRQSPQGQVVKFNSSNRRRAKKQNQGNGITKEQWMECMSFFNWRCAYSGELVSKQETRTIDHIVPINKGGCNEIWNVVPAYRNYNSSKQDKDLLEWYKKQPYFSEERLNKIYEWQEYAYQKWRNFKINS